MGIGKGKKVPQLKERLELVSEAFKKDNLFSSTTIMKTNSFGKGVNFGNQALGAAFFRPNIIFLTMLEQKSSIRDFPAIIQEAKELEVGILLYVHHAKALLGQQQNINIWIKDRSPTWSIDDGQPNPNLSLLIAYQLKMNWNAEIRLLTVIRQPEEKAQATAFLTEFINLSRLPIKETIVREGDFYKNLETAPLADLNIFGISPGMAIEDYQKIANVVDTTCMFIMDSGHESVFA